MTFYKIKFRVEYYGEHKLTIEEVKSALVNGNCDSGGVLNVKMEEIENETA